MSLKQEMFYKMWASFRKIKREANNILKAVCFQAMPERMQGEKHFQEPGLRAVWRAT